MSDFFGTRGVAPFFNTDTTGACRAYQSSEQTCDCKAGNSSKQRLRLTVSVPLAGFEVDRVPTREAKTKLF